MLFGGYDKQNDITNRLPMPVDILADTAYVNTISSETLQLYYWNSGALTQDAGQAAGTVVIAKFAYTGILDSLGGMIGSDKDSSVTGIATILTSQKPCDYSQIGAPDNATLEQIAADLTANFSNGQYCIDYRNGILYGKKATTGTSFTVGYKVQSQTTGGGTSIAATVKLTDGTDILDVLVQDAAFGTASKGLGVFGKYQATPTTYTDGDAAPILLDANGRVVLSSDIEIGAVELKDADTDGRANIKAANTARTTGTLVLATQNVGADGTVNPTGSLNSNAPFSKITDGTNDVTLVDIGSTYGFGVGLFDAAGRRMPSMDAIGYEGYIILSDGVSMIDFLSTGVGASGIPVAHVDANGNRTPAGDDVARALSVAVGDGTNEVDVIATINSLKSDVSSVGGEVVVADNGAGASVTMTLPVGGKYNSTPPTYTDGDVVMNQYTSDGKLRVDAEVTLVDYTDDSNEFTVASSKGLAMMGVATSDSVDADDIGALRMTVARNLGVDITTKDGSAWAVDNAINTTIGDGTTVPVVETDGTKKALNVNVTDGTNDMPTMDANSRAGYQQITDGSNEVDVIATINSLKSDLSSVAGTATSVNTGTRDAGTQRVTIATDDIVPISATSAANDSTNPIYVKEVSAGTDIVTVDATGAAAISAATAASAEFKLIMVTCHLSAAPTTSENFTVTLNSAAGAAYDTVLYSTDPSLSSATDLVFLPDSELKVKTGDEINVAYTNTDTRTYGVSIYYQLI